MITELEFEPEELDDEDFDEGDEHFVDRTCTSSARINYKWMSIVIAGGTLLAPLSSDAISTTHPSTEYIPYGDFEPNEIALECVAIESQSPVEAILSPKECLLDVKHFLTLTTTDLASIMGVSRQAVYSWLQGGSDIRDSNLSRLHFLHDLSRKSQSTLGRPLSRDLLKANIRGKSLLSIMSADAIDPLAAERHLAELLVRASAETKKDSLKFSPAPAQKQMPDWMQADSIRRTARAIAQRG
jgi:hypothetical protein